MFRLTKTQQVWFDSLEAGVLAEYDRIIADEGELGARRVQLALAVQREWDTAESNTRWVCVFLGWIAFLLLVVAVAYIAVRPW